MFFYQFFLNKLILGAIKQATRSIFCGHNDLRGARGSGEKGGKDY